MKPDLKILLLLFMELIVNQRNEPYLTFLNVPQL